jgi:pimeloyl-ACP methyl ester carboxylesterase
VLDRHGMILVSAANVGNAANVLDRREPLALLAAHNVLQRYRVDTARIYVGGFSGGSRVALRLALAYPDVFRGVLLNAGSDAIGDAQIPLPPAPLFHQFQQSSRLVYVTGKHDSEHLDQDARSRSSMQSWCVFDVATEAMPWIGHEPAEPGALDRALSALADPGRHDADKLAACRARIDEELAAKTHEVEKLLDNGKSEQARTALNAIDARYGGLAAPRSIELSKRIDAR